MKHSLCAQLTGLSDAYVQAIKTKLKAIPKEDYWARDAHFTKDVNEENENVVAFMVPFHEKSGLRDFAKNWIRFYWETKIVTDSATNEETEIKVRKFEVKPAIKTLWQSRKSGSRIWLERHDHDESARHGCRIEDIAKK